MPSFTSGEYVPPGVYIEEETSALVSVVGTRPTVVAIVGPSVGYRVNTEAVVLTGTTPVSLAKVGINGPTSTVGGFQVAAADGTLYTNTTDFVVADGGGGLTTIARPSSGSAIGTGSTVYVTYRYADDDYHAPLYAQDYDDVREAFGDAVNLATGEITSPLSLAAKVAFENGAGRLVLVATEDTADAATRDGLSDALDKLGALNDVNIVVPLPVGLTADTGSAGDVENVANDLRLHVETQSGMSQFRMGIIGFETSVTRAPESMVATFRSPRVVMAWPNRLSYYNGPTNSMIEVGGYYLAAAYAGRLASQAVQMPLTKKPIRGFAGMPASMVSSMNVANKNTWSAAGIAVTEIGRDGAMTVRHGTTTQRDSIDHREISVVRAKDSLVDLLQTTMDRSGLIGSPITDETMGLVKSVVTGVLETAVNLGTVFSYANVKVRQQPGDPSIIEVKFQYQPAYPINYILVVFSVNTITGETDLIAA